MRQLVVSFPMRSRRINRLLTLNDDRLAAYLGAPDDDSRAGELERVIRERVQPKAAAILGHYIGSDWPIYTQDVDDVVSQVSMRVVRKLRAASVLEEECVENLEAYVVTLTRNAARDLLRSRSPERARLRSRLRYIFTRDARLALWTDEGLTVCGLAGWTGAPMQRSNAPEPARVRVSDDPASLADAAVALLRNAGRPVRLSHLVSYFMRVLQIEERPAPPAVPQEGLAADARFESREFLEGLWREISELPPRQRVALLLNLRAPGTANALFLFVVLGVASFDALAEGLGMTSEELAEIWNDLPFDDLTIADRLGVTRQQVINLRKAARERLARRLRKASN